MLLAEWAAGRSDRRSTGRCHKTGFCIRQRSAQRPPAAETRFLRVRRRHYGELLFTFAHYGCGVGVALGFGSTVGGTPPSGVGVGVGTGNAINAVGDLHESKSGPMSRRKRDRAVFRRLVDHPIGFQVEHAQQLIDPRAFARRLIVDDLRARDRLIGDGITRHDETLRRQAIRRQQFPILAPAAIHHFDLRRGLRGDIGQRRREGFIDHQLHAFRHDAQHLRPGSGGETPATRCYRSSAA